ncbi:unnamed protein product, partial [Effrenium voratum]
MVALQWLPRLALRSAPIWTACAEVTETALKERAFVRDHFADAVHCLALVSGKEETEAALVAGLLKSAEVRHTAPRFTAEKTLQVLHAASMMELGDSALADWADQAARLARQMSLPDRRILQTIALARPRASPLLSSAAAGLQGFQLVKRFMKHDAWENALFVHWPVPAPHLAELLPRGLEPDIMDGSAWVGLVLLTERGVSSQLGRCLPPIDHLGANVRTYVRHNGVPGIFFWSLECSSVLASLGARLAGIPYFPASMSRSVDMEPFKQQVEQVEVGKPGFTFEFSSRRSGLFRHPTVTARWRLPGAEGFDAGGEDEEEFKRQAAWFVERYSVYAAWPWGKGPLLLRGD